MTKQRELDRRLSELFENFTIEELLEEFDIEQEKALMILYDSGLIDPERFSELIGMDVEGITE